MKFAILDVFTRQGCIYCKYPFPPISGRNMKRRKRKWSKMLKKKKDRGKIKEIFE
jgi:hypothetical protein